MKKYVLTCDLKDHLELKEEYIKIHEKVWPEIIESIKNSGIHNMEIFNIGNRLIMIIETTADFSFDEKARMDANNETVQKWEELMWKYQKQITLAGAGEKWVLMNKIFSLSK